MTSTSRPSAPVPSELARTVEALWQPQAVNEPYAGYERVRALSSGGMAFLPEWNAWFVTGHAANSALLRAGAAQSGVGIQAQDASRSDGLKLLQHMMLFHNGLSHQRLRGLVSAAFTPKVIEEQRELVRSLIRELLGEMRAQAQLNQGEVDVVAGLSHPLPARVIMRMLGLAGEDEARFVRWSTSVAELLGGANQTPELMARIEADAREMKAFFRDLADELRVNPQPGLLSAMAAAEDSAVEGGSKRLSGDELLSNAVLLLTAGHETTSNLIPGGLLELSRQPQAWAALVDSPRHPNIPDELLRVVSPVQYDGRTIVANLTVGDTPLKAGQFAQLLLAAANRDPDVFPEPGRLDFSRANSARHLAFAAGPHYCLGASLAKLEIAEVYAALAEEFPNLQVVDQHPPYKPNPVLRGVERLMVRLNP